MRKIYFVSDRKGHVKIGCSADPEARMASLQTATPSKLLLYGWISGDLEEERFLHDHFSDDHVFGEWFNESRAFADFMDWIGLDFRPGMTVYDVVQGVDDLIEAERTCGSFLYRPEAWGDAVQAGTGLAVPKLEAVG